MSAGHEHGSRVRAGARHARALAFALGLVGVVLVVEVVVGLASSSLALLSDAGHMATDVLGLGMALAAIRLANRGTRRSSHSFGLYRLEILGALANAVLLVGVAAAVLWEAAGRIGDAPDVTSGAVLAAGTMGLLANAGAWLLLREGARESLNVQGAYLEVLADLVGSMAVVGGAVVIAATGWNWVDPVIGAALGLWILPRTLRLALAAVRVLVQAAPARVDVGEVAAALEAIEGVVDVHDVHVWTLTSEMDVATAHLVVDDPGVTHAVLDQARLALADRWHIEHATLQVEPSDHEGCDDLSW